MMTSDFSVLHSHQSVASREQGLPSESGGTFCSAPPTSPRGPELAVSRTAPVHGSKQCCLGRGSSPPRVRSSRHNSRAAALSPKRLLVSLALNLSLFWQFNKSSACIEENRIGKTPAASSSHLRPAQFESKPAHSRRLQKRPIIEVHPSRCQVLVRPSGVGLPKTTHDSISVSYRIKHDD